MHAFFHKPPEVDTVCDLVQHEDMREEENLGNGDLGVSLIYHHVWRRTGVVIWDYCTMGRRRLLGAAGRWIHLEVNLPAVP